jgi:hypothetical protein
LGLCGLLSFFLFLIFVVCILGCFFENGLETFAG